MLVMFTPFLYQSGFKEILLQKDLNLHDRSTKYSPFCKIITLHYKVRCPDLFNSWLRITLISDGIDEESFVYNDS